MASRIIDAADKLVSAVGIYLSNPLTETVYLDRMKAAVLEYQRERDRPRNCDLHETMQDAEETFGCYCVNYDTCSECPLHDPRNCRMKWLMEREARHA